MNKIDSEAIRERKPYLLLNRETEDSNALEKIFRVITKKDENFAVVDGNCYYKF